MTGKERHCLQVLGNLFSRIVAFVWRFMPWSINRTLGHALAFLWFDVLKIRRQVIYDNLKLAFPEISSAEQNRIGKAAVQAMCRSFFDVLKVPSVNREWIRKNVIFHGEQNIKKLSEIDGGVFFLTLHLGSGDLGAAVFSEMVKPLTLISKRFTNIFLDTFWFGVRERSKTKFINAHAKNNAFEILAALKKKRGVVFVMDQFMGMPYGLETQFFGVKTGTAYGLALFAKKTARPVYPLYTHWDDNNKLHIYVDEAIDLSSELGQTNEEITNKFNQVLEKIITRHPEHWMWVHKRWKTFE